MNLEQLKEAWEDFKQAILDDRVLLIEARLPGSDAVYGAVLMTELSGPNLLAMPRVMVLLAPLETELAGVDTDELLYACKDHEVERKNRGVRGLLLQLEPRDYEVVMHALTDDDTAWEVRGEPPPSVGSNQAGRVVADALRRLKRGIT